MPPSGQRLPVLLPADMIDPGPHNIGGTWMTFWQYAAPVPLEFPSPDEAAALVNGLSAAMKDFCGELPVLGVWERACRSAGRLSNHSDSRIQALLHVFAEINEQMRLEPGMLLPCHGDAHAKNLLPSPEGWIWTDFEDVCLMPAYWDLASFVGNLALFGGVQEPTFRAVWDQMDHGDGRKAFRFAINARILMSTLGNLDFALSGHGDLKFAAKELELAGDFIRQIDRITGR